MTWRTVATAAVAVVVRPRLWRTALRQARRMAPAGWYRRAPFLPVPSRPYLEFRLATQYGANGDRSAVRDVIHYLTWCRQWDSV